MAIELTSRASWETPIAVVETWFMPPREEHAGAAPTKTLRRDTERADPRALRSRESLRAALLRLVEHRTLDQITLRDITAEAGVSYPTFFNHYDSKEALFQDVAREEIGGLLAAFRRGHSSPGWRPGRNMCAHILQRRGRWRVLLTTGASEAMRSEFIRRGRDLATGQTALGHGVPLDVVSGVIASGSFEIIAWWLAQDEGDDPDRIGDMLEALVIEPGLNLSRGYFADRHDASVGRV